MKHTLLFIYAISVIGIIGYLATTTHTGTESYSLVERPKIGNVTVKQNHSLLAVVNGDTIPFKAASMTRCDELYKYTHCIGYGKIVGLNQWAYIYVKNDEHRLITVEQMLAEQK